MSSEPRYKNNHLLCNAKNNSCGAYAVKGKTKCRNHGGLSLSGPESPRFIHGKYSKYLPTELQGKYEEARNDPDLLTLRDEIGLLDARLMQLIEKIPSGGGSHSWKAVREAWKELIDAQRQMSNATTAEQKQTAQRKTSDVLARLNEIIDEGAGEAALWNDIITSIDNRRKLTQTEARRLADMEQYITSEKAIALVYAILDIIRRNVPDKGARSSIATEVRSLITIPEKTP